MQLLQALLSKSSKQ